MVYRLYTPEDFLALHAIEQVCFKPPLRFSRRTMRQLVRDPSSATWIAEENGNVAGFAIVVWAHGIDGPIAYIQTVEVMPEQRGRGTGKELLRHAEASARRAGAAAIWLHVDAENNTAVHVYETLGYQREGSEANYYPNRRAAFVFLKRLGSETLEPPNLMQTQ